MTKRSLSLNEAIDLLHQRAALRTIQTGDSRLEWFLIHRTVGPVTAITAAKIIGMPDVIAGGDGLFPDSQTCRLDRGSS